MDSLERLEGIIESFDDGGRRLRRLYARRPDLYAQLTEEDQSHYKPTSDDLEDSGYFNLREWEMDVKEMKDARYE